MLVNMARNCRNSWVQLQLAAALYSFHLIGIVYTQTEPGVEVLRNNLQLAQTGLVVMTALGNLVLTLARGEERAESLMRDMPGVLYAVCFALMHNRYQPNSSIDAAVHLNILLRAPREALQWKISDVPFSRRIAPTRLYTVLMLSGINIERRAVLAARWLWYNFNEDSFLLCPARLRGVTVNGACTNCLFYELHTELEQWLVADFATVFAFYSDGDTEYLQLPCEACHQNCNTKYSMLTDDPAGVAKFPDNDLLILPNFRVLDYYEWLRIVRDLIVINDEVGRGATGFTSKQLLDGLQSANINTATHQEATHSSKISLGLVIECTVSLLLCAFVKIVPYLSTVIARRLVRSIVTGMTSKTAMIMPPGDIVFLMDYEDRFPGVRYTSQRPYSDHIKDLSYPLLAAGPYLATLLISNILWALSLGGYIPPVVGARGRVQASIFNLTVVTVSLCIWLAGTSWRIWKGTMPSSMGPLLTKRAIFYIQFILQLLCCILVLVLLAALAVSYAGTSSQRMFVRAMYLHFWIICACSSLLTSVAFCFIDSVYFQRSPNTSVTEPGTTTFLFAHILSQASLSLVTGNIY